MAAPLRLLKGVNKTKQDLRDSVIKQNKIAGMPTDEFGQIKDYVLANEKLVPELYKDSKGILTFGVGHKVQEEEEFKFDSKEAARNRALELYQEDLTDKINIAREKLPKFDEYPVEVKQSIVDGFFRGDLSGSPNALRLIKENKWEQVPAEYLDHEEYRKSKASENSEKPWTGVYKRMDRNAEAFKNYSDKLKQEEKPNGQQSSLSNFFMPSAQAATEEPPEPTLSSVEPGNLRKFVEANVPEATRKLYSSGSPADNIALGTLAAGKKTLEALYWPFRRMLEIPFSEVATAIQERKSLGELGDAIERAGESMKLWRRLEDYPNPKGYEDVAQNYWGAFMPGEAPGWYKGMFSLGAAITLGHGVTKAVGSAYKGIKALPKKVLTRPATLEETKVMQQTMGASGRKQLRQWGIRPQELPDKGAVLTTNKGGIKGEIRLSSDTVKLIKGKPVRVPKGVVLKKSKVAGYDPFEKVSFYQDPYVAPMAGGKVHPPMPMPEWRSKLIETVGQIKQPKTTANQLMNIINKAVPAAEISASNIEKFLADNPKPTKKEVLRYLEDNIPKINEVTKTQMEGLPGDTKFHKYTVPGGKNYREILLQAPIKPSNTFTSSHWDEPNVLAHMRVDDRTVDGKKILFLEEIQSDWAAKGRTGGVPYHPLLKKWQELTLKKALRIAAEEGYDGIAWTTGQQQADRYDLSKQIDSVRYAKVAPEDKTKIGGDYAVEIIKDGKRVNSRTLDKKELERFVGKDIAKRIAAGEGDTPADVAEGSRLKELKGFQLKVGGEWAKNLYDKQIPSILKKLTKKNTGIIKIKRAIGKTPVKYKPNQQVIDSIRNNDDLGFDNTAQAIEAIIKHNDWAERWEVEGKDRLIIEGWREEQVGAIEKPTQPFLPIDEAFREKLIMDGQYLFSPSATTHAVITDREGMIRLSEDITVEDSAGNKVKLLKGQEYTIYRLSTGAAQIQDGRQVTLWEGELDKLKTAGIELRWPNAPLAGGIMHEQNKKISNSAKKVQEEMQRVDAELEGKALMQDTLRELKTERAQYKNSISAYEKGYLKEELSELPSYYKTKSGGTSIDKAAQEAGFEDGMEMRDYLKDLDNQIKELQSEIESIPQPKKITHHEKTLLKRRAKDLQIGRRKGALSAQENLKNVQTKLTKFIRSMDIPPNEKNGLIARVTNVETLRQLAGRRVETIQKIADLMKEYSAKAEIKKMVRDIQKLPTKNLPLDYKEKIREIKKGLDLRRRTGRTIARRNSMKEFVERMKEEGEEIRIPQERLDELEKITLNDMTVEDLRNIHSIVTRLYHHGKLKNKLLTTKDKRNFQAIVNEGVANITKGEDLKQDSRIIEILNENKNLVNKSVEVKRKYIAEHLRPERLANMLDSWATGTNTKNIFQPIAEAEMEFNDSFANAEKRVTEINKPILKAEAESKKHTIGRFKGMTKNQAYEIYARSLNPHNRMILYNTGITDADMQDVANFLTDTEKEVIHNQLKFYDEEQWPTINKVYSELNGENMGKRVNYFPTRSLHDSSALEAIEMDILQRHNARRAGVSKGFTKETVKHKKSLENLDYFGNIYANLYEVEYYKAFAKPVRDTSKYLRNPKVKTAIKQKHGKAVYEELDKWIKDVSFGKSKPVVAMIDKVMKFIRLNFAPSVLGFKLAVSGKQSISFMTATGYLKHTQGSKKWPLIGMNKYFEEGWSNAMQFVEDKSNLIKYRRFRHERELREMKARRRGIEQFGVHSGISSRIRDLQEASMEPIVFIDKMTVVGVWRGAYESVLKTGKVKGVEIDPQDIESEAVSFANEVVRKTQPMGGIVHLAGVFRGPEYQKMFTIFKNQLNNNYNLYYEFYKNNGGEKTFGAKFQRTAESMEYFALTLLLPAFVYGLMTRQRMPTIGEFVGDVAYTAFGSLIVLNLLLQSWGDITPFEGIIKDARDTYKKEGLTKKVEKLIQLGSRLRGIPYDGIKNLVTGKFFGKRWDRPTKSIKNLKFLNKKKKSLRFLK